MSKKIKRAEMGSIWLCTEENEYGFTKGKQYETTYGGVDCYSNTELVITNDSGDRYFIYVFPFLSLM